MIAPANKPATRFSLGRCLATPGALAALEESQQAPGDFLDRHVRGDWGNVDDEDQEANEAALREGTRILSSYRTRKGAKLWVITEADRSATTILLPEEY
jgi:hypothetical protein